MDGWRQPSEMGGGTSQIQGKASYVVRQAALMLSTWSIGCKLAGVQDQ